MKEKLTIFQNSQGNLQYLLEGEQYFIGNKAREIAFSLNGALGLSDDRPYARFYDFHLAANTDYKKEFLNNFYCFKEEPTNDGHLMHFDISSLDEAKAATRNFLINFIGNDIADKIIADIIDECLKTNSTIDDRNPVGLSDTDKFDFYLNHYPWPKPNQCNDFELSPQEIYHQCLYIGFPFYNRMFYKYGIQVLKNMIPRELYDNMFNAMIENEKIHNEKLEGFKNIENIFIWSFDEHERFAFRFDLDNNKFFVSDKRYIYGAKSFNCSKNDYEIHHERIVLFISNWSLVIGTLMAVSLFRNIGLTIGEQLQ